ncbi:sugar transferase [Pontiellaceae bacterium B12227]|nr:sugar transferase [Pontiellaceae bacterium B12227]
MTNEPHQNQAVFEEALAKRITASGQLRGSIDYWRKRALWSTTVSLAKGLKRLLDIIVSLSCIILLSPLFAAVAILIKVEDSAGPVFYTQDRVGQWGKIFRFPKFRSMVSNAEQLKDSILSDNQHGDSVTFKMKKDPRVTRTGRFIRRLSIDELPQVWCVLRGDMSLVGPRPALPREVALYTYADRRRLDTKPGLTCIWQVSGRGDIPFPEQVKLDEEYINSKSIWLDIKLLFLTVPAVLTGKGAY